MCSYSGRISQTAACIFDLILKWGQRNVDCALLWCFVFVSFFNVITHCIFFCEDMCTTNTVQIVQSKPAGLKQAVQRLVIQKKETADVHIISCVLCWLPPEQCGSPSRTQQDLTDILILFSCPKKKVFQPFQWGNVMTSADTMTWGHQFFGAANTKCCTGTYLQLRYPDESFYSLVHIVVV